MINDAYKAVEFICKDGLQILKFAYMVNVANYLLHKLGKTLTNSFKLNLQK